MKNLSYVILDGNLTSDPESKTTPGGKSICEFTVAVNHGQENDVSFFQIQTWEKMAENCSEYLSKGSKVTVMGNLKQQRWKTNDGENRSKVFVIATTVRFDSKKKENNDYGA